jgi:hypothetical protein
MSGLIGAIVRTDGLTEIELRSGRLTLTVLPEVGGKILQLTDDDSGEHLLWENPRVPPRPTYPGAPFDDVWCGGWDDIFPTDGSCVIADNVVHDHGDLWTSAWSWNITSDDDSFAELHMTKWSTSMPCRVDKWLSVVAGERRIRVRMAVTNAGPVPVRFVWNQHIAHAITPGSRVHLPTSALRVHGRPNRCGRTGSVSWPVHENFDLSRMLAPDADVVEFLYADPVDDGWCVVTHPAKELAVRLEFQSSVFSRPWLWGVFGGWRGHYLLLTELCTSRPGTLASAIADGSAYNLQAGEILETEVTITVTSTFDAVAAGDTDPTRGIDFQ